MPQAKRGRKKKTEEEEPEQVEAEEEEQPEDEEQPEEEAEEEEQPEEEMAEEDLEEQIEEVTGSELNISIREDSISIDLPRDGNERERQLKRSGISWTSSGTKAGVRRLALRRPPLVAARSACRRSRRQRRHFCEGVPTRPESLPPM